MQSEVPAARKSRSHVHYRIGVGGSVVGAFNIQHISPIEFLMKGDDNQLVHQCILDPDMLAEKILPSILFSLSSFAPCLICFVFVISFIPWSVLLLCKILNDLTTRQWPGAQRLGKVASCRRGSNVLFRGNPSLSRLGSCLSIRLQGSMAKMMVFVVTV